MTKVYIIKKEDNYVERAVNYHFSSRNDNCAETICKNENGKPYISGENKPFISIAHSGKYAAIVISDKEVGVDIERHAIRDYLALSSRYFAPNERTNEDGRFFELWTKKEAYSKYIGQTLSLELLATSIFIVEHSGIVFYSNKIVLEESLYYISVCGELNVEFLYL